MKILRLTRLAKAESEASFHLAEKTKVEEKMKEIEDHADKSDHEVLITTNKLRNVDQKVKQLEVEKRSSNTFLKAVSFASKLEKK